MYLISFFFCNSASTPQEVYFFGANLNISFSNILDSSVLDLEGLLINDPKTVLYLIQVVHCAAVTSEYSVDRAILIQNEFMHNSLSGKI